MKVLNIFAIVLLSQQWSAALGYRAAVVEHYPLIQDTAINTILINLEDYRVYADQASKQAVDIIVFPEYGLTSLVDDPTEYAQELTTNNNIVKEFVALALERQMYVVVNLLEKANDNGKTIYYNTNLVFDKNGAIVAKYRKINLFKEPKLTRGHADQDVYFTTTFGVTFGIFTCGDILYDNPSRTVLKHSDVTDIIFPTAWFSTIPFYSSLTVQSGYVHSTGVNLLAANYGNPTETHGGSGIYLADGKDFITYIADTRSSKLIIKDVTLTSRQDKTNCLSIAAFGLPGTVGSNVTNYKTNKDFQASNYNFKNVDLAQKQTSTEICHGSFCCTFDITFDTAQTYPEFYKVMAFDGSVTYDQSKAHIRACSLLACDNDSNDSCGNRVNATAKFTKITVKGNLDKDETTFYTPLTLNTYLLPMKGVTYCDNNNGTNSSFVQLTTVQNQQNVLVFGLFGRTASSASALVATYSMILVIFGVVKGIWF